MEFKEKLQELRKQKGLTQEELGEKLFVSRTAISKWESGRGYPNIESLKCIARFFEISVDDLLSSGEVFSIAEQDNKQKQNSLKDMIFGIVDLSFITLLFLPFFAQRINGVISEVGLVNLVHINGFLKIAFWILVILHVVLGVITFVLIKDRSLLWLKIKRKTSIILNAIIVVLLSLSLQPYASILVFIFLMIKISVVFIK